MQQQNNYIAEDQTTIRQLMEDTARIILHLSDQQMAEVRLNISKGRSDPIINAIVDRINPAA